MSHYDPLFIKQCIESFVSRMVDYSGERRVYFDADNTLFLFSQFGHADESLKACYNKGFYKNLPVFQEAPMVVENLQKFGITVGILSSYYTGYAHDEKLQSYHYHFPSVDDKDIILVPYGKPKTDYVKNIEHAILVDDYNGNINDWYRAGGVALKKSFSGKKRPVPTLVSLVDVFYELHKLKFLK